MSRLQCPSQLLRAALRLPLPRPSPAASSLSSPHVLLPSLPARRAFSQTCRRCAEGEGSRNPTAPSSSNPFSQPAAAPFRPPAPPPPRVSIFAPTPTAALPDSAGYQAEAPTPSTPPGPSPLPRTFSWHAAQADRIATPMPEMAALVKDAARPGLGRSGDGLISPSLLGPRADEHREPFHLHVFAHRHNTHVTLSRPNRDAIISVSCGNLGFRKSKRKHYDAAYQLTQHVLQLIEKKQLLEHIHGIEVILSGFGQGREAAAKVLLSSEGSRVKEKIVRVSDATKIKFGGTRSRNPRRV